MTDTLTLFVDAQYASPYAMSAFVALTVKALPFELRTIDLSTGFTPRWLERKII